MLGSLSGNDSEDGGVSEEDSGSDISERVSSDSANKE
jgi:hypothetical protein